MAHHLLGGEDAAWLHMEEATNPMVVTGLLELAAPLPRERAHEVVGRLAALPRFRARVVHPVDRARLASWEETPSFDPAQHMEHVRLQSGGGDELRAFVGNAASRLLDDEHPLWRVFFIDRPEAGTTILFRIHHSIADGFALLGVLLSLCDESSTARATPTLAPPASHSGGVLDTAKALGRLVVLPNDPTTLLKGVLGPEKRVAWSAPLALSDVKRAAKTAGATVNDVLVATAAGALGRYLARRGESTSGLELHAMVPVNLRASAAPDALGNRFGLVILGLPLGVGDPLARVAAVNHRMSVLKATPEAMVTYGILRALGRAPRRLEELAVSFFGKKTSLVLTNVPGPRTRLSLAGVPVSRIMFWVPQSGRLGLGISIFSYAGEVTVGIMCDAALVPDPEQLVADLHADYAELDALVRAEAERQRPRMS